MKPEAEQAMDEERERAAITQAYRDASEAIAERPDPRVRATVLAAAARAVDAKPRDATRVASHPYAARRWPLSAAALLVVSVLTGVVATQGWRERPDLVDASRPAQQPPQGPAQGASADSAVPSAPLAANAEREDAIAEKPQAKLAEMRDRRPSSKSSKRVGRDVSETATHPAPESFPKSEAGAASDAPALVAQDARVAQPALRSSAAPSSASAAASRESEASANQGPSVMRREAASERSNLGSLQAEPDSPEAWVDRIVKLRAAGRDDEADREVTRLKRRYPGFTVPSEALRHAGTR